MKKIIIALFFATLITGMVYAIENSQRTRINPTEVEFKSRNFHISPRVIAEEKQIGDFNISPQEPKIHKRIPPEPVDGIWMRIPRRSPNLVSGFSMIYDEDNRRAIVFGGSSLSEEDNIGRKNETHSLELSLDNEEWQPIAEGISPPARYRHAAIYDSLRKRMIIFGGVDEYYFNDVWELSLNEVGLEEWRQLLPTGQIPTPRMDMTAIYDSKRDRMVIYGGWDGGLGDVNAVYCLDFNTQDGGVWYEIQTLGTLPEARVRHTAIYDPEHDAMIIFGGYGEFSGNLNDVWALKFNDSGNGKWVEFQPTGNSPHPRWAHTAVYNPDEHTMIVFGGENFPLPVYNDTYILELDAPNGNWIEVEPLGNTPEPRSFHGAVYDKENLRMVVYGGYKWAFAMSKYYQDSFALTDQEWQQLAPLGEQPMDRHFAGVAIYDTLNQRMVNHGGEVFPAGSLSDIFTINLDSPGNEATQPLLLSSASEVIRSGHVGIYDSFNQRGIFWGGYDNFPPYDLDTYFLDLSIAGNEYGGRLNAPGERPSETLLDASAIYDSLNQRMVIFGGWAIESGLHNEVYIVNLIEGQESWELLAPSGEIPSPRSSHSAIYDPIGQRMVVFGGSDGSDFINEVWELSLIKGQETFRPLETSGDIPLPRGGHTAVYDSNHHRMIVFGGYNNELYTLDLDSLVWKKRVPSGEIPAPRMFHSAIYDSLNDRMVVFSGIIGSLGEPSNYSYILSDLPD